MSTYRKKLIEVALPLDAINQACVEDKDQKTGHVRNLHKWFAPMPLPALRATIAASLIDDPGAGLGPEDARRARAEVMADLSAAVRFDAHGDTASLDRLSRHLPKVGLPVVFDPFCGGGSTIIEAQRLGLRAIASDLNPVPVLITKLLCELIPSTRNAQPVFADGALLEDDPYAAFAADVRHLAAAIGDRVRTKLAPLYPTVDGKTVTSWRWCHEVECPNPGCKARMPLVQSWELARGKHPAWIQWHADQRGRLAFTVGGPKGSPPEPTKIGRGAKFRCPVCKEPSAEEYIKAQGRAGRFHLRLLAIGAASKTGRVYLAPTEEHEQAALQARPDWRPDTTLAKDPRNIWCIPYGFTEVSDLFTDRQTVVLKAFADAVAEGHNALVQSASQRASRLGPECPPEVYAGALTTFLGLCVGKLAQSQNKLVRWFIDPRSGTGKPLPAFDKQVIQVMWDFAEASPFGGGTGDWQETVVETALGGLRLLPRNARPATVLQADARTVARDLPPGGLLVTDPPYYKNISYSDLSDFFYAWLRPALRGVYPALFGTIAAPKADELIAAPHRHEGDDGAADRYFQEGLEQAFATLALKTDPNLPISVVYALRQEESGEGVAGTTGWELMLEGLIRAGLSVVGTWPIRATREARSVARNTNALASAIVIVCRRSQATETGTRQELRRLLRAEVPGAVQALLATNILPVDLAQAAIGPGMACYCGFLNVREADGSAMTVRSALQLIAEVRDECLASGEGEFDTDTRFAVTWYEQHGWEPGAFGIAENLAKANNVSVKGIAEAGIAWSAANKFRLLKRSELPAEYDPDTDARPTVWEFTQHMIRYLEDQGEGAAARLLKRLGSRADATRELAYRLYNTCERKKRTEDARSYNGLILAWPELERLAARMTGEAPTAAPSKLGKKDKKSKVAPKPQQDLFEGDKK